MFVARKIVFHEFLNIHKRLSIRHRAITICISNIFVDIACTVNTDLDSYRN